MMLNKTLKQLQFFHDLDPQIPLTTVVVFLTVAGMGGKVRQADLAACFDMSTSALSRNISILDTWSWLRRPGLGLLKAEVDLMDRRAKIITLTHKGRTLVSQLKEIANDATRDQKTGGQLAR